MRARPADDATAIALAVALHAGLGLLLWFAMRPSEVTQASAGGMAADVVDVGQLSAAMRRTLRDRPQPDATPPPVPAEAPQPEPEPVTPPTPAQPEPAAPAPVAQEEVVETPTPQKATAPAPQEAARPTPQPDPNAASAAAKAQQEVQRRERERLDQLAQIRARRAAAAREALAAEARLEQLTAPRGGSAAQEAARSDAAASGAGDDGLLGRYAAALQASIRDKWVRPDNIPSGAMCRLVIRQLPGGEVIDVQVSAPCSYDEAGRRSIEAAVLKAQPLPYTGFEKVFKRELTLNFKAP